jgi:hypothetical protein
MKRAQKIAAINSRHSNGMNAIHVAKGCPTRWDSAQAPRKVHWAEARNLVTLLPCAWRWQAFRPCIARIKRLYDLHVVVTERLDATNDLVQRVDVCETLIVLVNVDYDRNVER